MLGAARLEGAIGGGEGGGVPVNDGFVVVVEVFDVADGEALCGEGCVVGVGVGAGDEAGCAPMVPAWRRVCAGVRCWLWAMADGVTGLVGL